jgi:hypothetical protein
MDRNGREQGERIGERRSHTERMHSTCKQSHQQMPSGQMNAQMTREKRMFNVQFKLIQWMNWPLRTICRMHVARDA